MSSYWANFIKTGNPNGKNLPEWPKYNSTNNRTMILDIDPQVKRLPDKNALNFLISQIKRKETN
jgi:para-nitrobenzyl esterase